MARISVICATPPKPNPGMSSVDLAFYAFSKRHGFAKDVTYYQLYTPEELHTDKDPVVYKEIVRRQQLPFEYECFRNRLDEIKKSDVIIFWGDFLHMANYQDAASRNLCRAGIAASQQEALQIVREHLFLINADSATRNKVIMFGSTLLFNRSVDYQDTDYGNSITEFLKSIHSVRVRDVYSAFKVSEIRSDYDKSFLGMDCSLLLQKDDMKLLERSNYSADESFGKGKVGIFFGRSDCDAKVLGKFAGDLCKVMGLQAQWLSWRLDKSSAKVLSRIKGYFKDLEIPAFTDAPLPGDLYEILARYSFVITDTYHVCVNAWRMGIPAVCIGQAVLESEWSVSSGGQFYWRDKRQVFYSMYDATEYYTYVEELNNRSQRKKRIEQLVRLLGNESVSQQVADRLQSHARNIEITLLKDINELSGKLDE